MDFLPILAFPVCLILLILYLKARYTWRKSQKILPQYSNATVFLAKVGTTKTYFEVKQLVGFRTKCRLLMDNETLVIVPDKMKWRLGHTELPLVIRKTENVTKLNMSSWNMITLKIKGQDWSRYTLEIFIEPLDKSEKKMIYEHLKSFQNPENQ